MDPDIPDSKMLSSHVCTPGLLYTRSPTLWTHGIGLIVVFSHGLSPIKEKHYNATVVWDFIVKKLCDYVRETVRV